MRRLCLIQQPFVLYWVCTDVQCFFLRRQPSFVLVAVGKAGSSARGYMRRGELSGGRGVVTAKEDERNRSGGLDKPRSPP